MALLLRPLVAFALFLAAALLGRLILKWIPKGKLHDFLAWRLPVYPQNEAERRDWWPVFFLFLASALLIGWMWWLNQ